MYLKGKLKTSLLLVAIVLVAACKGRKPGNNVSLHLTLEVQPQNMVRRMCDDANDTMVNYALTAAGELRNNTKQPFLQLFATAFRQKYPKASLAALFVKKSHGKLTAASADGEVVTLLTNELNSAAGRTVGVLSNRLRAMGASKVSVKAQADRSLIDVDETGIENIDAMRHALVKQGRFEIFETYTCTEIFPILTQINDALGVPHKKEKQQETKKQEPADTGRLPTNAELKGARELEQAQMKSENPLFALLSPPVNGGSLPEGPVIGMADPNDEPAIKTMLTSAKAAAILPKNMRLAFNIKSEHNVADAYALKIPADGAAMVNNLHIVSVKAEKNVYTERYDVVFSLNAVGTSIWAKMTDKNTGRFLAMTIDGMVYSCPRVQSAITGGSTAISGTFTKEEAEALATALQGDPLPLPLLIVQEGSQAATTNK